LLLGLAIGIPAGFFILLAIAIIIMRFKEWDGDSEEQVKPPQHKKPFSPFHKKNRMEEVKEEEKKEEEKNESKLAEEGAMEKRSRKEKKAWKKEKERELEKMKEEEKERNAYAHYSTPVKEKYAFAYAEGA
jgi:hypothetical protein